MSVSSAELLAAVATLLARSLPKIPADDPLRSGVEQLATHLRHFEKTSALPRR